MQQVATEDTDFSSGQDRLYGQISLPRTARRPRRNYWARADARDIISYPKIPPLPYLQEARLFQQAQQGDERARNELWVRHARLAMSVTNYFRVPDPLLADVVQEGVIGLQRAISKFDVQQFNAFSTYAWHWVAQHIHRFLDYHGHFVRIPSHLRKPVYSYLRSGTHTSSAKHQQVSVQQIVRALSPTSLDQIPRPTLSQSLSLSYVDNPSTDGLDPEQVVRLVRRTLPRRDYLVIKHRFGLGGTRPKTLARIATSMRITRERVRQIEKRSLDKLRTRLTLSSEGPRAASSLFGKPSAEAAVPTSFTSLQSDLPLERHILHLLSTFSYRQANVLIHFYGLLGHQPLPLDELAELLEISPQQARRALRSARRTVIRDPAWRIRPELESLRQTIREDDSFEKPIHQETAPQPNQ